MSDEQTMDETEVPDEPVTSAKKKSSKRSSKAAAKAVPERVSEFFVDEYGEVFAVGGDAVIPLADLPRERRNVSALAQALLNRVGRE